MISARGRIALSVCPAANEEAHGALLACTAAWLRHVSAEGDTATLQSVRNGLAPGIADSREGHRRYALRTACQVRARPSLYVCYCTQRHTHTHTQSTAPWARSVISGCSRTEHVEKRVHFNLCLCMCVCVCVRVCACVYAMRLVGAL